MKYIAFWKFKSKDLDKVIELSRLMEKKRTKFPENYTKWLFPPHVMSSGTKGFTIVEGTSEQITNVTLHFLPVMKSKYVPIFESTKITEQYRKMKK